MSKSLVRKYGLVLINLTKTSSVEITTQTSLVFKTPMYWWYDQSYTVNVPNAAAELKSIQKDLNDYYESRNGRQNS
jgi:hypothetical protein